MIDDAVTQYLEVVEGLDLLHGTFRKSRSQDLLSHP